MSAATAAGQLGGPVIVVGAGPVGTTAALLLADAGIGVIMLERHAEPHPLPRAVHLDDEVIRALSRAGVGAEFLARSRPCSGLRLLDAGHRVMAEFGRAASGCTASRRPTCSTSRTWRNCCSAGWQRIR